MFPFVKLSDWQGDKQYNFGAALVLPVMSNFLNGHM